ncbi:MAG TPA: HIT family protein [Rhodocyclaceae bacterium]|nr:HIT family protein [Rhodocyclaceae bacterium]
MSENCELCRNIGGTPLWEDASLRVVRVADADYPGFCRVIWKSHVREMTDLAPDQRQHLMQTVFAVEGAVRKMLTPDKINLASFGNMTPHLHWHIIPRWQNDRHFPEPVWGKMQREAVAPRPEISDTQLSNAIAETIAQQGEVS